MQESQPQQGGPQQWRIEPIHEGAVAFDCPKCHKHHVLAAETFASDSADAVKGLTATNQAVGRIFGGKLLSLLLGLGTYYLVHRGMFGPEVPLNQAIVVPVLAAVAAYGISLPLFNGIAQAFSKGLRVYRYECPACRSEMELASDGKQLALPVETKKAA